MENFRFLSLRQRPEIKFQAAAWFHSKWGVPTQAYLECMEAYLSGKTEYGWYLCMDGDRIVGGMGVIENDFHNRKDQNRTYAPYTPKQTAAVRELPDIYLV